MFAFCATSRGGIELPELETMAAALRGAAGKPVIWCDDQGRAGFVAATAGILAEDVFDRQPLTSSTVAFGARARIDNRDEILEKLSVPVCEWPVIADSEVLFRAYLRWEQDCVQHIYGDYAFAAWHRQSGKVVAAIDHLATARLYYSQTAGRLIISTQLGGLLAHPRAARDLDLKALGLLVAPKIEAGSTPWQHVRALVGGHLLIGDDRTLDIHRWWQPDTAIRTRYRDPGNYVLAAQEAFDRAVRARLRTTGGVASMMSGGLDSTLVTATAARQLRECGRGITGYLSVPQPGLKCDTAPGLDADDSPYATAVAQMHDNLTLVKLSPAGTCPLEIVPEIHAASRTPVRNGANHIWFAGIWSAARATGARVVLHGGKGNATISQTGEEAPGDLIRQMRWRDAARQARLCIRADGPAAWRKLAGELAGQRGRAWFRRMRHSPAGRTRPGTELLTAEFRAAHASSLESFARPVSDRSGQIDFMMVPGNQWTADAAAQWGVEDRDPTGDRRLIELLLSFPLEAFSVGGWPRGLARAMGIGRVPDMVRFRRTRGAQVPEIARIIALHSARYRDVLEVARGSAQFRSIFEGERVRALLERVCTGSAGPAGAPTLDRVADVSLFLTGGHA